MKSSQCLFFSCWEGVGVGDVCVCGRLIGGVQCAGAFKSVRECEEGWEGGLEVFTDGSKTNRSGE